MSIGSIVGAVVGGIVGFFIGGPSGAFMGASLGFSLGMAIDPLTPDIKSPGMAVEPLQVTSNIIGTPIPDLLGTSRITGFLLGYGLERSEPQYTKGQGSKGGKKTPKQLTGYKYYASWQLGICFGPADSLYTVYKNDNDVIWEGEVVRPLSGGVETVAMGDMGTMRLYFGTDDQPADATVAILIGDATLNSPLKGLCYAVFDDCYIGTYNRLPTMSFVLRRTPTIAFSNKHQVQIYDYNPMHAIWYWMVTLAGLSETWLHSADFAAVALVLYGEKRGITALLNDQRSLETYIETANAHIDAILRYGCDAAFHPKLIRDDYDPDDLETIDETMLLDKPEFSRGSWINTVNEVKAQYSEITDRKTPATVYFGCVSGNVLRFNATTLAVDGVLVTSTTQLYAAAIDTIRRVALFGRTSGVGVVVFVDLDTFTEVGSITLGADETSLKSIVVDELNGIAYVSTEDPSSGYYGWIIKIDINTRTRIAGRLSLTGDFQPGLNDTGADDENYVYIPDNSYGPFLFKIGKLSFSQSAVLTLGDGTANWQGAVGKELIEISEDLVINYLYFVLRQRSASNDRLEKISLSGFNVVNHIDLAAGERLSVDPTIDTINRKLYIPVTGTTPKRLVKIDLESFVRETHIDLTYTCTASIYDKDRDYIFTTYLGYISTIKGNPFALVSTINAGAHSIVSAVIG